MRWWIAFALGLGARELLHGIWSAVTVYRESRQEQRVSDGWRTERLQAGKLD